MAEHGLTYALSAGQAATTGANGSVREAAVVCRILVNQTLNCWRCRSRKPQFSRILFRARSFRNCGYCLGDDLAEGHGANGVPLCRTKHCLRVQWTNNGRLDGFSLWLCVGTARHLTKQPLESRTLRTLDFSKAVEKNRQNQVPQTALRRSLQPEPSCSDIAPTRRHLRVSRRSLQDAVRFQSVADKQARR